jgi:hypothetical protein
MRAYKVVTIIVVVLCFIAAAQAQTAAEPAAEHENSGQDPANPVKRLDLRLQYQQVNQDISAWIFTPRLDVPMLLGDGWKLGTRVDVPLIRNNTPSLDNLTGDWESGLGDVLTQFLLIKPLGPMAVVFGTQAIFPTATQDQFDVGGDPLRDHISALSVPAAAQFRAARSLVCYLRARAADRPPERWESVLPVRCHGRPQGHLEHGDVAGIQACHH